MKFLRSLLRIVIFTFSMVLPTVIFAKERHRGGSLTIAGSKEKSTAVESGSDPDPISVPKPKPKPLSEYLNDPNLREDTKANIQRVLKASEQQLPKK